MKLSIIVPIYNVEDTLKRCIDSITSQSFKDIELLLIDDGSPDNSGKIADEIAESDQRIRVFHKSNGGLSDARNYGLGHMTGDYVTFVDSDDELAPNTLMPLMQTLLENPHADFLEYPVTERYGQPDEHLFIPDKQNNIPPLDWLADKGFSHCWVCNKIFKSKILKNIRFEKNKKYEDVLLMGDVISQCHNIATTDKGMYIYHWNPNGIVAERNMHLLLEAQCHTVGLLNIDLAQPKWQRLYIDMFTTQLHAYKSNGKVTIDTHRIALIKNARIADIIKTLMINCLGVRLSCIIFKLLKR